MSEKPISPLRRRMLDDMTMRRFTPDTQRDYIRFTPERGEFLALPGRPASGAGTPACRVTSSSAS
jgi:hypothetical protein